MAASNATVEALVEVILKYVPKEALLKMVQELQSIKGNTSFKVTVERITRRIVETEEK